jgi:hypothetical protein
MAAARRDQSQARRVSGSRQGSRSVMVADTQQQRLLERLHQAGGQPIAFSELHAGGIHFPAAVVSELELGGYAFERVREHGRMIGVRLLGPEPAQAPAAVGRRRRPWSHRRPAAVKPRALGR